MGLYGQTLYNYKIMITLLSPAKLLNFEKQQITDVFTIPRFMEEAGQLISKLRELSEEELANLMDINDQLARLNYERYQQWSPPFTTGNAKQSIFSFNGEVYNGLKAAELTSEDLKFAQETLRMLSGLYGLLRPLDLIQPYRLEMNTKLQVGSNKNLYEFWGDKIYDLLKNEIQKHKNKFIINLASNEYGKAAKLKKFGDKVITPVFKELKGEHYKVIVVYTKKARGMMSRFIIQNRIDEPEQLKHFEDEGYFYNDEFSSDNEWCFSR